MVLYENLYKITSFLKNMLFVVLGIPRTHTPLPSRLMLIPESEGILLLPHSRSACFISGSIKDLALHSFLTRLLLQPSWYTWPTPNLLPVFMLGGYQRFSPSGSSPHLLLVCLRPPRHHSTRLHACLPHLLPSCSPFCPRVSTSRHLISCPWINSIHLSMTRANHNKSWPSSPTALCHMPGHSSCNLAFWLHMI